jgi:hypothetical protein
MLPLVVFLTICIAAILIVLKIRMYMVQSAPEQKLFSGGKLPSTPPEGLYRGTVKGLDTSWIGKTFFSEKSGGINNFRVKDSMETVLKYPFKTYVGKGLVDRSIEVLKIDYDIPQNPFWLKFILDEIVETEPNKFLGKVHLRFMSGITFTLGYFTLEK